MAVRVAALQAVEREGRAVPGRFHARQGRRLVIGGDSPVQRQRDLLRVAAVGGFTVQPRLLPGQPGDARAGVGDHVVRLGHHEAVRAVRGGPVEERFAVLFALRAALDAGLPHGIGIPSALPVVHRQVGKAIFVAVPDRDQVLAHVVLHRLRPRIGVAGDLAQQRQRDLVAADVRVVVVHPHLAAHDQRGTLAGVGKVVGVRVAGHPVAVCLAVRGP